jgi:hypothetical protein
MSTRDTRPAPEGATLTRRSGWVYPTSRARKSHFIESGRSLCGGWMYLGHTFFHARADERCKACSGEIVKRGRAALAEGLRRASASTERDQ